MEIATFVTIMLMGNPSFVADLKYTELRDVFESVRSVTLSDAEDSDSSSGQE